MLTITKTSKILEPSFITQALIKQANQKTLFLQHNPAPCWLFSHCLACYWYGDRSVDSLLILSCWMRVIMTMPGQNSHLIMHMMYFGQFFSLLIGSRIHPPSFKPSELYKKDGKHDSWCFSLNWWPVLPIRRGPFIRSFTIQWIVILLKIMSKA